MKEYSVEHKFTANSEFINRGSLSCSTSEYQCSISNNEDITDTLFDIPGKDFYYLRVCDRDRGCVQTFIQQCLLLESGFKEVIEVALSPRRDIIGVSVITPIASCNGTLPKQLPSHLHTRVDVLEPGEAPEPETKVHVKRMEAEKKRKLQGDTEDNRSFFAKYWMYIVPVLIVLMLSGQGEQNE